MRLLRVSAVLLMVLATRPALGQTTLPYDHVHLAAPDQEAARVCPHPAVVLERHLDTHRAVRPDALAKELAGGIAAEVHLELVDPVIDLPEEVLLLRCDERLGLPGEIACGVSERERRMRDSVRFESLVFGGPPEKYCHEVVIGVLP